MTVERSAVERGTVTPQFGWGSMATTQHNNLAYLSVRQNDLAPDSGKLYEIGVVGHGPGRHALTARVVDAIQAWDQDHRSRTADFEIHPTDASIEPKPGRFAIDTPFNRIVVDWL